MHRKSTHTPMHEHGHNRKRTSINMYMETCIERHIHLSMNTHTYYTSRVRKMKKKRLIERFVVQLWIMQTPILKWFWNCMFQSMLEESEIIENTQIFKDIQNELAQGLRECRYPYTQAKNIQALDYFIIMRGPMHKQTFTICKPRHILYTIHMHKHTCINMHINTCIEGHI